ncbi:MAG: hypothetical protein IPM52_13275 [Bacteroidetes bacterium]|nr:hypothetical protein [Bacteroidota bacterium]
MVTLINKILFTWRLKRAISLANIMTQLTHRRYLVLLHQGKPRVFEQQQLKQAIRNKRFIPEFSLDTARKIALHITTPKS